MTLVHGLEGGRQAVVVRVHHAMVDGLGLLTSWPRPPTSRAALSTSRRRRSPPVSRRRLLRAAVVDTVRHWCSLAGLLRTIARSRGQARLRRAERGPSGDVRSRCAALNAGTGGRPHLCDRVARPRADAVHREGQRYDGQRRAPRRDRRRGPHGARRAATTCRPPHRPFGIAPDRSGSDRCQGNLVTPPSSCCATTSTICGPASTRPRGAPRPVELRKIAGLDSRTVSSALAPRGLNAVRRLLTKHTTITLATSSPRTSRGPVPSGGSATWPWRTGSRSRS